MSSDDFVSGSVNKDGDDRDDEEIRRPYGLQDGDDDHDEDDGSMCSSGSDDDNVDDETSVDRMRGYDNEKFLNAIAVVGQIQSTLNQRFSSIDDQKAILTVLLASLSPKKESQAEQPQVPVPPPVPLTEEERLILSIPVPRPLFTPDIVGIARYIREGHAKNIIVMCGAGISVSAGIPDFRTPGTGLYYNVQKYNLPDPQDVFALRQFRKDPRPFYEVAKSIYPDKYHPTKTHYFIRLLHEHGLLLRDFTQNIDTLEHVAGIPEEKTVFSHGSFSRSHCVGCHKEYSYEYVRDKIFADEMVLCECGSYIKPDITFFGEPLPENFFVKRREDFPQCDLLIVMGTSLKVQPFAGLISLVRESVPRLLINREVVATKPAPPAATAPEQERFRYRVSRRFAFNDPTNRRDALYHGSCDDGCEALAYLLGWDKELQALYDAPIPGRKTE